MRENLLPVCSISTAMPMTASSIMRPVARTLLSLALDKVRAAGIIAEDAVLAIVDAVMSFAVEMLQIGNSLLRINNQNTAS